MIGRSATRCRNGVHECRRRECLFVGGWYEQPANWEASREGAGMAGDVGAIADGPRRIGESESSIEGEVDRQSVDDPIPVSLHLTLDHGWQLEQRGCGQDDMGLFLVDEGTHPESDRVRRRFRQRTEVTQQYRQTVLEAARPRQDQS